MAGMAMVQLILGLRCGIYDEMWRLPPIRELKSGSVDNDVPLAPVAASVASLVGNLQFNASGGFIFPQPRLDTSLPATHAVGIPCLIHQQWKNKEDVKKTRYMRDSVESFKSKNPECVHRLWDDSEIDAFVAKEFPELVPLEIWRALKPIQRADLFRYMVVFLLGGFYADLDVECRIPIKKWGLHKTTRMVVGYETGHRLDEKTRRTVGFSRIEQFEQWTFGAAPGHPILQRCLVLFRMKFNWGLENTVELTGPGLFSDAVREFLLTAKAQHTLVRQEPSQSAAGTGKASLSFPPPGDPTTGVLILSAEEVSVPGFSAPSTESEKTLLRHGFKGTWKTDGAERFSLEKRGDTPSEDWDHSDDIPQDDEDPGGEREDSLNYTYSITDHEPNDELPASKSDWPTGTWPNCSVSGTILRGEPGGNAIFVDLAGKVNESFGRLQGCTDPECALTDKFQLELLLSAALDGSAVCARVCHLFKSSGCQFWMTGEEKRIHMCWLRQSDYARDDNRASSFRAGTVDCMPDGI